MEPVEGNVTTFNKQENYNSEEEWGGETSTIIVEKAREKKFSSSLKDESASVVVLPERMDYEND